MATTKLLELCALSDVLSYPGMDKLSAVSYPWIGQLIRGFADRAQVSCNRQFYAEERTQQFSVEGNRQVISLPAYGNAANVVATVKESLDREFATATALDATDYYFDWRTGLLRRTFGMWLEGPGVVQVKWTGGLGTLATDVPHDLRMAAVLQVMKWWQRAQKSML